MTRPKGNGELRVAIASSRPERIASFGTELEIRGFRVDDFRDAWSLLEAARGTTWNIVLLDGHTLPVRENLERLMEINACQQVAVITNQDADAFHEATEGLGVLTPVPAHPTPEDVEPLLERLRAVGALDPRVEAAQAHLNAMSRKHHPNCVVCWDRHPVGLKVDYRVTGEHTVEGTFGCGKFYEGYSNVVHGGIVSSLLDGAMASCILAKGLEAYTVELKIRYRSAVETGVPATIRGQWLRSAGPIHLLHATLEQNGKVRASARAKFFEGTPNQPSQPMPGGAEVRNLLSQARKRLV